MMRGNIYSELLKYGGGARSILLLPLVARCMLCVCVGDVMDVVFSVSVYWETWICRCSCMGSVSVSPCRCLCLV